MTMNIEQLKQKMKTTLVGGFHLDMHRLIKFIKSKNLRFNKSYRRVFLQDLLRPIFEEDKSNFFSSIYTKIEEFNNDIVFDFFQFQSLSQFSDSQLLLLIDRYLLNKRISSEALTQTILLLLGQHDQLYNSNEFLTLLDDLLDKPNSKPTSIESFWASLEAYFIDLPGDFDGLTPNQWRSSLYCLSSIDDLYTIGSKFGISLPRAVNKPMVYQRIMGSLQNQGIPLNSKIKQRLEKASLSGLFAIGRELNLPITEGLDRSELIELILLNVKSKTKYASPSSAVVYIDLQMSVFTQYFHHLLAIDLEQLTDTTLKETKLAEYIYAQMIDDAKTILIDYKRKFDAINERAKLVENVAIKDIESSKIQGNNHKISGTGKQGSDLINPNQNPQAISEVLLASLSQRLNDIQAKITEYPSRREISQMIPHEVIEKTTHQLELQDQNFARFEQQLLVIRDDFKDYLSHRLLSRKRFFFFFLFLSNLLVVAIVLFFTFSQQNTSYLYLNSPKVLLVNDISSPTYQLVPKGSPVRNGQVDEYTFEFNPAYSSLATIQISVIEESKMIGDINNPFNHLLILQLYVLHTPNNDFPIETLEVDLIQTERLDTFSHQVYVRLFIVPPANPNDYEDAYEHLAGKKVSFSMLFEVTDETV